MKKLLLLYFIYAFFTFELNATQPNDENHNPSSVALQHFSRSKELIEECLKDVPSAQLHFFWTTGRTISDKSEYHPITKVDVGGSRYGQQFFVYVKALLENSPSKLKINFICDIPTRNSNIEAIRSLRHAYKNRFELLSIESVQANLLKAFSTNAQQKKIKLLFKNATQGSPVIASDVYRYIGMIFGQDTPPGIAVPQHIYCDIDTLCCGMKSDSFKKLISALFKSINKSPFYFGRSEFGNDVIKLCIRDLNSHHEFCAALLKKITTNNVIFTRNLGKPVTTYFSKLHDMIKKCETDREFCSNILPHIPDPIHKLIKEVMWATGPEFDGGDKITRDLAWYPHESAAEWRDPAEVLDYNDDRYVTRHPTSVLNWGYTCASQEERNARYQFTNDCNIYKKLLSVYYYAKRFGEKHPFNLRVRQYLLDLYPYKSNSFKSLLYVNFDFHNKDRTQDFRLRLMDQKTQVFRVGLIYVKKNSDNKLDFVTNLSEGEPTQGTLDVVIETELDRRYLDNNKAKILRQAEKQGIVRPPIKGQSYEEWKKNAFNQITKRDSYHYCTLTKVINDLRIEMAPLMLESLGF